VYIQIQDAAKQCGSKVLNFFIYVVVSPVMVMWWRSAFIFDDDV
jgi:hypothetical protein